MRATISNSGLCCCSCDTYFECQLTPLNVKSVICSTSSLEPERFSVSKVPSNSLSSIMGVRDMMPITMNCFTLCLARHRRMHKLLHPIQSNDGTSQTNSFFNNSKLNNNKNRSPYLTYYFVVINSTLFNLLCVMILLAVILVSDFLALPAHKVTVS